MIMHSMLFENPADSAANAATTEPGFFGDLHLDQIVDAITAGRQEYDLKPFFYAALHSIDAIEYRHEIFRELENKALYDCVVAFEKKMQVMRAHLARAKKLYYDYQKERFSLDSMILYCEAVEELARDLAKIGTRSRAFTAFRGYLSGYVQSDAFTSLLSEAREILSGLSAVRYCFTINGNVVKVRDYEAEIDYSADVQATFEKFKQGEAKDYLVEYNDSVDMNHIEAQILDLVARLNPDLFLRLDGFCAKNALFLDDTVSAFDR
jgi:hypothetical protein